MIEITRRARFSASHCLHNPELSEEENAAAFGECGNPHGHGHNYGLEVTVRGEPDPRTGMLFNLKELQALIAREIVAKVDHKNLNFDVDFLRDKITTSENLAVEFWRILEPKIPRGRLHEVRVCETENNSVAYRGERSPDSPGAAKPRLKARNHRLH